MTATTVAPAAAADADLRRAGRYQARHYLWNHSRVSRIQACGRVSRTGEGVSVKVSESPQGRNASYGGVSTCGSFAACPVCSAKIAAGRNEEIRRALTKWTEGEWGERGRVAMVTMTMRHHYDDSLEELWDGKAYAWHAATSGAAWKADQLLFGSELSRTIKSKASPRRGEVVTSTRIPIIAVTESNDGENGWHIHVHAALLLRAGTTEADAQKIGRGMWERWRRALGRKGLAAGQLIRQADGSVKQIGYDVRWMTGDLAAEKIGQYFTKSIYGMAKEIAQGPSKKGRGGNLTPFQILESLVTTGEEGCAVLDQAEKLRRRARWREWERVSRGRRMVAWTAGLRAALLGDERQLTEEERDQEFAEQDRGGLEVGTIEPATWRQVTKARADWAVLAAFIDSDARGWELVSVFRARAVEAEQRRTAGIDRVALPRPGWRRDHRPTEQLNRTKPPARGDGRPVRVRLDPARVRAHWARLVERSEQLF